MLQRRTVVRQVRKYSEALKRQVVLEFESGRASARELMQDYDILSKGSIYNWCRLFGTIRRRTNVVRVIMKSEKEKIRELEKALAEAMLENRVKTEVIRVLEEDYAAGKFKKKLSTEQLKKLETLKAKLAAIQSGSSVES